MDDDYKDKMDARQRKIDDDDRQLSDIFKQFAGREIDVIETPFEYKGRHGTRKGVRSEITGGQNNPVIQEMNQHAENVRLKLTVTAAFAMTPRQLCWPEVIATVEKNADGKYRISPKFEGNSVIDLKDFLP